MNRCRSRRVALLVLAALVAVAVGAITAPGARAQAGVPIVPGPPEMLTGGLPWTFASGAQSSPTLDAAGNRMAIVADNGERQVIDLIDLDEGVVVGGEPDISRSIYGEDSGTPERPDLAADGSVLVFDSDTDGIAFGDSNGRRDVIAIGLEPFPDERLLVSEALGGAGADGVSSDARIDGRGRYVAFASEATNLVAGDGNGYRDIFLRDLVARSTVRVSVSTRGIGTNGDSSAPDISDNGRWVTFDSVATTLVEGDTNGHRDVFLWDRTSGDTILVSRARSGAGADGDSWAPAVSADGRYVTFASDASNLVAGDTNGRRDVFRWDRTTGRTVLVSHDLDGGPADGASDHPAISADGATIVFESSAPDITGGDSNRVADIMLWRSASDVVARVSVAADGGVANGPSQGAALSGDGSVVAFTSRATNLAAGDDNGVTDVFRRELAGGSNLPVAALGTDHQENTLFDISDDGRYLLVAGEPVGRGDIAIGADSLRRIDRLTGAVVSIDVPPAPGLGAPYQRFQEGVSGAALSGNGQWGVAYHYAGFENPSFPEDWGNEDYIDFVEIATGRLHREYLGSNVNPADPDPRPLIDSTGRYWAYEDGYPSTVNLYDRVTDTHTRLDRPEPGNSQAESWGVRMSANGRWITFLSTAGLVAEDSERRPANDRLAGIDLYRYDRLTGELLLVTEPGENVWGNGDISDDGNRLSYFAGGTQDDDAFSFRDIDLGRATPMIRDLAAGTRRPLPLPRPYPEPVEAMSMSGDGRVHLYETRGEAVFIGLRWWGPSFTWIADSRIGTVSPLARWADAHLARDGGLVVFESRQPDLVPADRSTGLDRFVSRLGPPTSVPPTAVPPTTVPPATTVPGGGPGGDGYWMLGRSGILYAFGDAEAVVPTGTQVPLDSPAVKVLEHPDGTGLWVLEANGTIGARGGAAAFGPVDTSGFLPGEQVSTMAAAPGGTGLWVFTNRGRAIALGTAVDYSDLVEQGLAEILNGPIIDSAALPDGSGYYMLGADGGVFTFGAAAFAGSVPQVLPEGVTLNSPVNGLVVDPDGSGYWMVAGDGGVFAFDADFVGSIPGVLPEGVALNAPINGMVPYGNGYLMVASDGGVFTFSDKEFLGSLGGQDLPAPIVGIAPLG